MKKLLSILLTVVMAVCLVNLNSGHVDALDVASISYTITLKSDGTSLVQNDGSNPVPSTIASYDLATNTITIHKSITETGNVNLLSVKKTDVKIVIEGDIILTGKNKNVIASLDGAGINLVGDGFNTLKIVGTTIGGKGLWASGGISFTKINVDIDANEEAIVFGGDLTGTLTLDNASKVKAKSESGKAILAASNSNVEPTVYSKLGYCEDSITSLTWQNVTTSYYSYFALNDGYAKYVELNYIPLYEYTNNGWTEYHTENLYKNGDSAIIKNTSSSNVTITENQNALPAPSSPLKPNEDRTYGFTEDGSLVTLRDKKINITNEAPISCSGLIYNTDNYWYHGSTLDVNNKLDDAAKLANYGIVKNDDGSYTFNKSLTTNSVYQTVKIIAPVNIVLGNDISITNTAASWPAQIMSIESVNVKIDGQGHKLVLEIGENTAFSTNNSTTLKDIELIALNNDVISAFYGGNSVNLEGKCIIEVRNKYKSAISFALNDFTSSGSIQKVGSVTQKGQKEDSAHKSTYGVYVVGSGDMDAAKYVRITNTPITATTTSEPTVKDESCEKVIGPTWHWNNTKGVCEEYTLVRTNTR